MGVFISQVNTIAYKYIGLDELFVSVDKHNASAVF